MAAAVPQQPVQSQALAIQGAVERDPNRPQTAAQARAEAIMRRQRPLYQANEHFVSQNLASIRDGNQVLVGHAVTTKKPTSGWKKAGVVALGALSVATLIPALHPSTWSSLKKMWSDKTQAVHFSPHMTPQERAAANEGVKRQYSLKGSDGKSYDTRNRAETIEFARNEYKANPERFTEIRRQGFFLADPKRSRVVIIPTRDDGRPDFESARSFTMRDLDTNELITDATRLDQLAYKLTVGAAEIKAEMGKAKEERLKYLLSDSNTRKFLDGVSETFVKSVGFDDRMRAILGNNITALEERLEAKRHDLENAQDNPPLKKAIKQEIGALEGDLSAAQGQLNRLEAERVKLQAARDRLAPAAGGAPSAEFQAASDRFDEFEMGRVRFLEMKLQQPNLSDQQRAGYEADLAEAKRNLLGAIDSRFRNWRLNDEGIPVIGQGLDLLARSGRLGQSMIQMRGIAENLHHAGVAYDQLVQFADWMETRWKAANPTDKPRMRELITLARRTALTVSQEDQLTDHNGNYARWASAMMKLSKLQDAAEGSPHQQSIADAIQACEQGLLGGEGPDLLEELARLPNDPADPLLKSIREAITVPQYQPIGMGNGTLVSSDGRYMQMLRQQIPGHGTIAQVHFELYDRPLQQNVEIQRLDTQINELVEQKKQDPNPARFDREINQLKEQKQHLEQDLNQNMSRLRASLDDSKIVREAMNEETKLLGGYENAVSSIRESGQSLRQLQNDIAALQAELNDLPANSPDRTRIANLITANKQQLADQQQQLGEAQAKAGHALSHLFHSYNADEALNPINFVDAANPLTDGAFFNDRQDAKIQLQQAIKAWKPQVIVIDDKDKSLRLYQGGVKWDPKSQTFKHKAKFSSPSTGIKVKMSSGFWDRAKKADSDDFVKQLHEGEMSKGEKKKGPREVYLSDKTPEQGKPNPLADIASGLF